MKPVRVIIFAKAPIPGLAKTRLIPSLGKDGAAVLARRFLYRTLEESLAAAIGTVELCATPEPSHACWRAIGMPAGTVLSAQGEGDLGLRMACAAQRALAKGESVLLIGTDCPALDRHLLKSAAQALNHHDCCLIPAHDGGYTLLGLNRYHRSLFERIPWSTAEVANITRARMVALGWSLAEFPAMQDIDEPVDLARLPEGWCEANQDRPYSQCINTDYIQEPGDTTR